MRYYIASETYPELPAVFVGTDAAVARLRLIPMQANKPFSRYYIVREENV